MAMEIMHRVVDNRVLVLGLDGMYRSRMREVEATKLLDCARTVAHALRVEPAAVPVEGYYAEEPELTKYFLLMRALQQVGVGQERRVRHLPEFELLRSLVTSGLYGPTAPGFLLPAGRDPLTQALERTAPGDWTVAHLLPLARSIAETTDDFSLVGLAARANDPVAVAATRESVVLYAMRALGRQPQIEYVWRVDEELERAADRFIRTLNRFVLDPVPPATAENAATFYHECENNILPGRCVMIGIDRAATPPRFYHWAIARDADLNLHVEEFWDVELRTTASRSAEAPFTPGAPLRPTYAQAVAADLLEPGPGEATPPRFNWGRLVAGLVLAEVVPATILLTLTLIVGGSNAPGTGASVLRLADWVGPVTRPIVTGIVAWWVARDATGLKLRHGIVLGGLAAVVEMLRLLTSGGGIDWPGVVTVPALLIAGAFGGGLAARRHSAVEGTT